MCYFEISSAWNSRTHIRKPFPKVTIITRVCSTSWPIHLRSKCWFCWPNHSLQIWCLAYRMVYLHLFRQRHSNVVCRVWRWDGEAQNRMSRIRIHEDPDTRREQQNRNENENEITIPLYYFDTETASSPSNYMEPRPTETRWRYFKTTIFRLRMSLWYRLRNVWSRSNVNHCPK